MNQDRIDRLTDRQRECLSLVYSRHTISEVAGKLGLTVDGVNYHLQRARETLGVGSSATAARLVFGVPQATAYISPVAPQNAVSSPEISGDAEPASSDPDRPVVREVGHPFVFDLPHDRNIPWPFQTQGRPENDLRWYQILAWGLGIAFGATAIVGSMLSIFRSY